MDRKLNVLVLISFLLLGCSGGGGGSLVSTEEEVPAPVDRSTVSQLNPLVLSITDDAPIEVAVDSPNYYELGFYASATDADGYVHFFYGNKELHHRYFDGEDWIEEIIDDSSKVGSNATVVLDDDGVFHVLYQDLFSVSDRIDGDYLKYAHGTTGNWTIEVTPLSSETLDEHRGTLALNSGGDLYFAHLADYDLVLSKYSGGVWSQELVVENVNRVSSSGLNSTIEMILDSDGIPHIFYTNTWEKDIEHATKVTGVWVAEKLGDGESNSNLFSSATLDEAGNLNVCFSLGSPAQIYCSELTGGAWTTELIGSDPIHSYLPTLKIDDSGFSHLVYYVSNDDATSLRYASNKTGTWQFSTYELSSVWQPSLDNPISLEVSDTGNISIFLINLAGIGGVKDELLLVNYDGVIWSQVVINYLDEERAASGEASTIKVSPLGSVEIVYPADTTGYASLKVATLNEMDDWSVVEPISNFVPDVPPNDHIAPEMEIDAQGKKHIISASQNYDPYFNGITYSTNKTGAWQQEFIPNTSHSNKYDLVISEDSSAHIVYFFDAINNQVRYVTNKSGSWVDELVYEFPNSETDRYKSSQLALALKVKEESGVQILMYQPFRDADPIKGLLSASKVENGWDVASVLEPRDVPARFTASLYGGRPFYVGWSYPSLVIDENDIIHMTYNAVECNTITCVPIGIGYSNNDGGLWSHKVIDGEVYYLENSFVPKDPSFSIAENGDVYIVYYHEAYEEIRLANVNECAHNYVVLDQEISTRINDDDHNSISASIDTSPGTVHVSYHDNPNGYLKYAEVSKAQLISNCQDDEVLWVQNNQEIGVRSITVRNDSSDDQRIEGVTMYDDVSFEIITDECTGNVIAVNESCSISVELDSNLEVFYSNSISLDVLNMQSQAVKTIGINFEAEVY